MAIRATCLRLTEFAQHRFWHRMRRQLAICAADDPDALFRTFDAGFALETQPMFDVEAGRAECDLAGDIHIVAVARRFHETRARAHERKSGELKNLRHVDLGHSERAL